MMTPAQLKAYEFKTAGRNAYKAEDVDSFFGEVAVDYEKMFRENSELIKRISLLAERLEQYKNDEGDIKQAVMSAQKAANVIIQEAEDSVADSRAEAEAILAAAKGEADIIKADAEKQAIADAELALSVAKDKAEEIIAKAKEKAHGILIAANDSASDTMGAANRTITSESLHYEMLKKEVSEFRASVLAQYKAHIELISKLPELAVEEASKAEEIVLPEKSVEEIEELVDNDFQAPVEETAAIIFTDDDTDADEAFETEDAGEPVIKTELPYDFYDNSSTLEYINDDVQDEEPVASVEDFSSSDNNEADTPADIPISKKFKVDLSLLDVDDFDGNVTFDNIELKGEASYDTEDVAETENDTEETSDEADNTDEALQDDADASEEISEDEFGYEDDDEDDYEALTSNFFENIEKIDAEDDGVDDKPSKGFGFFKRKK